MITVSSSNASPFLPGDWLDSRLKALDHAAGLLEPAIAHIAKFDILRPHGIMVAEHPADRVLPGLAPPYRIRRTYRYGKIGLTVYCRDGNETNEELIP